ncbi:MAG: GHMP kinase [Chloroflexi bacterium]|nr:MAG: GHMP kinase [Chloroflexota bacterium]
MIIVQTPLRVSLFGGGTDFPDYFNERGGCVLSTAIDKYIFVTIKKRFDSQLRIGYTKTELVDNLEEIQHDLIREALRKTQITEGVEISTMGDIPTNGSGLGSSSTVTVGALHAMHTYIGELPSAERIAKEACSIEIDVLKAPIGIQDQYIAAYGGFRFIEFSKNKVEINRIELDPRHLWLLNNNLMLFFTGVTRQASSILAEQKNNIKDKYAVLDEIKNLAHVAYSELNAGNIDAIGSLLHEGWLLKRSLASQVSNGFIDDLYETARQAGAIGGKIAGAGGGGFLLVYCPYEKQEAVRNALKLRELPFKLEADGTKVIFNYHR